MKLYTRNISHNFKLDGSLGVSFFVRYWSSSVNTLQGARLSLLNPILYPSFKHELDFNVERQLLLSPELTVHAQATLTLLHCWEAWNYYPTPSLWSALTTNTFKVYTWNCWRTRHIGSTAIDIFSKQQSAEQWWVMPFPQQKHHPSWRQAFLLYFHITSLILREEILHQCTTYPW